MVYCLLQFGSEECLISKELFNGLNLEGDPLQVLLIKADDERSLISTYSTNIADALVLDKLPDLKGNYPTSRNLKFFDNGSDLIKQNKFL